MITSRQCIRLAAAITRMPVVLYAQFQGEAVHLLAHHGDVPTSGMEHLCRMVAKAGTLVSVEDMRSAEIASLRLNGREVRGCVGIPLKDATGAVAGVLVSVSWEPCPIDAAMADGLQELVALMDVPAGDASSAFDDDVDAQVKEAIRASEARYHRMTEEAMIGIVTIDMESQILDWNRQAHDIFGYTKADVLGASIEMLISERQVATYRRGISLAIKRGQTHLTGQRIEINGVRKDGRVFPIEMFISQWTAGEQTFITAFFQDISRRKRALAKLKKHDENLAAAQALAHLGSWDLDVVTQSLTWSDELYRIFGLDPKKDNIRFEQFIAAIHEEDRERVAAIIGASRETKEPYQFRYRIVRPDGTIRVLYGEGKPVLDEQGELISLYGIAHDITEAWQAEEELRKSEANLAAAQAMAHVGSWEFDTTTQTVAWSNELYRIYGMDPEKDEISFGRFAAAIHEEDRERVLSFIQTTRESKKPFQVRYRAVRPDGSIRIVHGQGKPVVNEQEELIGLYGITQDITEAWQAEEALRKSEANLAASQALAHLGSWDFDLATGVLMWSDEHYRIFGLEPQSGISFEQFVAFIHEKDREHVLEAVDAAWKAKQAFQMEYRIVRPDGTVRRVYGESKPVVDDQGELVSVYGTIQDVTQRWEAEQALSKSEANLAAAQALAHLGSWEYDLIEHRQAWSDELYRIYGLDPEKEASPEQFIALLHEDDRERVLKAIAASHESLEPLQIRHRIVRPNGQVRMIYAENKPIVKDGQLVGVYGISQDITEAWQAEEALKASQELLATVMKTVPTGVMAFKAIRNGEGQIIDFEWLLSNDLGMQLMRWEGDKDELIGSRVLEVRPETEAMGIFDPIVDVVETGRPLEMEFPVTNSEVPRWLSMNIAKMGDGYVNILQDITRRKQAEVLLQQSEREYRHLFEYATDAILMINPTTEIIVAANKQALEMYGYNQEEMVGKKAKLLSPDALRKDRVREVLEAGYIKGLETVHYRKDGTPVDVQINASIATYENQSVLLSFIRDITQRLQNERKIKQSHTKLARLTKRLQTIREEERTKLAYRLQEHLGQGLAALKLDIEFLLARRPDAAPYAERLATNKDLVTELIQDVRRMGADLRPSLLDTLGLTIALEGQMEKFERSTGIRCRFAEPPAQLAHSSEWAMHIFRMVQEVLTNVELHAQATAVTLSMVVEDQTLVLTVCDDGCGITKEEVASPHALGLLGLHERVRHLKGEVDIEGVVGEGTTVTFRVPVPKG